ncbi:hypothetical protein MIND_00128200 [Mycena indigotica]|uniref:Protein kinase domain-containing protein n=1 Tax=Mycena indigotica TaxID=2126181 RepID=A0A8H6TEW8_9AGAR|nr:uncharacterized protein MIND_00128200 [Mycena indigotica]KAF7316101.1 hypothetical protein MIND_00128200 [Mycena indigotica]
MVCSRWFAHSVRVIRRVAGARHPAKRRANQISTLSPLVPRHVEAMAFESPSDTRKLNDVSLSVTDLINAAVQIFLALFDVFNREIIHRDISMGNILLTTDGILLIDWETGRRFKLDSPPPSGPVGERKVTGTLDTMAYYMLDGKHMPLPHDDLESAVYVLLKALTQTFKNPLEDPEWQRNYARFKWDKGDIGIDDLKLVRDNLWSQKGKRGIIHDIKQTFREADEHCAVQFIDVLLSMPLPQERWSSETKLSDHTGLDATNYDAVHKSLDTIIQDVVKKLRALLA